jgi:SAM-dependent methyltransferase
MSLKERILQRRNIRTARWHEEISEYFGLEPNVLEAIAPRSRQPVEDVRIRQLEVMDRVMVDFMDEDSRALLGKVQTAAAEDLSDLERSSSWRNYIFVCINGERMCFQRFWLYEKIIECAVRPSLSHKQMTILDYGCGCSLFTRLLNQDFPGQVKTISADVCKYAVEFAMARNQLYDSGAEGFLIEDVMSAPEYRGIDLILANNVFEHLPNSTVQIQSLIDALAPGGFLIENYPGDPNEVPPKSDTLNSHRNRSRNLDMIKDSLQLIEGELPEKKGDTYGLDPGTRIWIKDGYTAEMLADIKSAIKNYHQLYRRIARIWIRLRRQYLV